MTVLYAMYKNNELVEILGLTDTTTFIRLSNGDEQEVSPDDLIPAGEYNE